MSTTETTELAVREHAPAALVSGSEFLTLWRVSKALASSQYFNDAARAEQAFTKVLIGRDLGLSPTAAIMGIHMVEGRPELSANLHAVMVRNWRGEDGERYSYKVTKLEDDGCTVIFRHKEHQGAEWEDVGVSSYTPADAELAGLTKPTRNGKASNHVKFPRNMLFARAMTNGVAWYCPEVTAGNRLYAPGEIEEQAQQATQEAPTPAASAIANDPVASAEIGEDIADAEVVEEASAEHPRAGFVADTVTGLLARSVWTLGDLKMQLVSAGAQDTSSVGAALATMSAEQVEDFANLVADLTADNEDGGDS